MKQIKSGKHKIEIKNEDKIYFPDAGITKSEVIEYYLKISEYILPYMKQRAVTMHRFPEGIYGDDFYQHKASDYFPDWIEKKFLDRKEGGKIEHVICKNEESLLYLVNQGCIVPHIWLSQVDRPDYPDKMLFDLDPPKEDLSMVKSAALTLKNEFNVNLDLPVFVMSTGSNGIHVVVPLDAKSNFDSIRKAAQKIAKILSDDNSETLTTEVRKNKRKGKLYLDTTRNAYSQTSVAPYSLRAVKNAPVAYPMEWEELENKSFDPQRYTLKNIFKRLSQKEDPWKNFNKSKVKSEKLLNKIDTLYS